MITLGVESTAHTLGIGISRNGKVLSNAHDIYKPKGEGIIPRKAADHHMEVLPQILQESLSKAQISLDEVDLFSFAQGPGIGAPLSVGCVAAKTLALKYSKPLMGVNHPYAHVKIAESLTRLKTPLILYVSGGNTQILMEEKGKSEKPSVSSLGQSSRFRVLGETLDIGIGNLFDSFARATNLEYAHGSTLEKLAKGGKYIELPYTVKGMNLSFTGLQTAAIRALDSHSAKDVSYSLLETSFSMCCEALERALFLTRRKSILLCGGVAQNKRLQQMLNILAKEDKVKFGVCPDEYNRDNGAMIAYAGELLYKKKGTKPIEKWEPEPFQRIDSL
ncbi:MAG: tRNA (adenosine(37)-N6)-threonylcarbamoyltransferase complex transferase subunit TsaD [bacterium]|nr:tRNA (adenosine(37)-N6)-threonylcarbamoyltransferase complex transferase subunit TsaD [bacterium]